MKTSSPLRYPGGKSAMSGLLSQLRRINGLGYQALAEPFAGGAGASLTLLYLEEAPEIFINDADSAIHDFWWAVLNRSGSFLKMIARKRTSMAEWRRQRATYRDRTVRSRLRRGFAAFYLNRCNRSGIIKNGGPIGGIKQGGEWKLGARYNKQELILRCQKITEFRDRIHVSGNDGIQFIKESNPDNTFYFIDPPYFKKGKTLYLNTLDEDYHFALAAQLKSMRKASWILTYDDCAEIRKMYRGWAQIRPFTLRYVAAERRSGKEILIAPKWMSLPAFQDSAAISW
jgi:DNA adenine methylase